ncbi:hypothetical protein [Haloferula sp.]|uniref:hypothetical protein n=1 Tax=Haloferula sp. TaxID=2497595 RepID=UPI003C758696
MNQIESITQVQRRPYKDILFSAGQRTEVDAPVIAFYEVMLFDDAGVSRKFDTEMRQTPRGLQVDWYEDLDDYLFAISSRDEANQLREKLSMAIYEAHDDYVLSGSDAG